MSSSRHNNDAGFFNEQCWLTAHNAWHTNQNPGNNQSRTITELLDYGVRGFALDIWGDGDATNWSHLHLQHGENNPASAIDWSKILQELSAWLAIPANSSEIVTLFFESYLTGKAVDALDASLKTIPCYKSGKATQAAAIHDKKLASLVSDNHRLFAFLQEEPTSGTQDLFPVMTDHFTENVYGDASTNKTTWVSLRDGSRRTNCLTFMNHFNDSPADLAWRDDSWARNAPAKIEEHAADFYAAYSGRYPNFISLDRIDWTASNPGAIGAFASLRGKKSAWRYVQEYNGWMSNAVGWDKPQYYETVQVAPADDGLHLVARSTKGVDVYWWKMEALLT